MTRPSPRPVPVEDLFAPPEYARPTISPDGRRLAFLAPWRTRLNVHVLDLDDLPDVTDLSRARRVTADERRPVLDFRWSDDPRHLLYLQDSDGDENHHLFRVDLEDPDAPAVDLTPYPGARVWRLHEVPGSPGPSPSTSTTATGPGSTSARSTSPPARSPCSPRGTAGARAGS